APHAPPPERLPPSTPAEIPVMPAPDNQAVPAFGRPRSSTTSPSSVSTRNTPFSYSPYEGSLPSLGSEHEPGFHIPTPPRSRACGTWVCPYTSASPPFRGGMLSSCHRCPWVRNSLCPSTNSHATSLLAGNSSRLWSTSLSQLPRTAIILCFHRFMNAAVAL